MDACNRNIDLNIELSKAISALLREDIGESTLKQIGEIFEVVLTANNKDLYLNGNLYVLISLLKRLKLDDALLLGIMIEAVEANALANKIFTNTIQPEGCNNNTLNNAPINRNGSNGMRERMQKILVDPTERTKTFIMFEIDPVTGEEIEISRRVVSEPSATDFSDIFSGMLNNEIEKEAKKE